MKSYFKIILIQPLTTDSGRDRWTRTTELIRDLICEQTQLPPCDTPKQLFVY